MSEGPPPAVMGTTLGGDSRTPDSVLSPLRLVLAGATARIHRPLHDRRAPEGALRVVSCGGSGIRTFTQQPATRPTLPPHHNAQPRGAGATVRIHRPLHDRRAPEGALRVVSCGGSGIRTFTQQPATRPTLPPHHNAQPRGAGATVRIHRPLHDRRAPEGALRVVSCGGSGIRTHGTPKEVQQFSRLSPSSARPSLLRLNGNRPPLGGSTADQRRKPGVRGRS